MRYNPWPDEENVGRARSWWPLIFLIVTVVAIVGAFIIGDQREAERRASMTSLAGADSSRSPLRFSNGR